MENNYYEPLLHGCLPIRVDISNCPSKPGKQSTVTASFQKEDILMKSPSKYRFTVLTTSEFYSSGVKKVEDL